ncbi:MAG: HlyC/CorC family transporter [Acidimicrobiales bacterium]|nr:HlyC/CorC family transporter [Acidimicrobiales bacterium]MCB9371252.1 HlyC/CorC family transporter [Microthrixaceae bacterium]
MDAPALLLTVALLALNGWFVAVEFALIAARRTKLEQQRQAGSRAAGVGLALVDELSVQLAGAQLGVTVASLLLGYVAEPAVSHVIESAIGQVVDLPEGVLRTIGFVTGLSLVVLAHMVLGEMVPKNLTLADPERALRLLALPTRALTTVLRPVIAALNAMANAGVWLLRVERKDTLSDSHSPEELASMLDASREEGLIAVEQHELLARSLGFGEAPVSSVMVPRERIVHLRRESTPAEFEEVVVRTGHSRLPVVGRDRDDIVGFVHAKDLLTLRPDARDRPLPERLLRTDLVEVDEGRTIEEAMVDLRRRRHHLGVVRGADGRTAGLVFLEDLVEQLVGDIRDESDRERLPPSASDG